MRYESPRSAIGQCVVWHGHLFHEKALDSLRHRCGGLVGAHLCFFVSHQNTEIVRIEKGGEMIKKELLALVPQAKRYIALTILCQWLQLVSQIAVVFSLSAFLQAQLFEQDPSVLAMCLPAFAIAIVLRYVGQKGQSLFSYRASADVKKVLREKLFQKLLRL